jgi:hypothetical protein
VQRLCNGGAVLLQLFHRGVRVERSQPDRRNGIIFALIAALSVPSFLYALGAAVAWIRRG